MAITLEGSAEYPGRRPEDTNTSEQAAIEAASRREYIPYAVGLIALNSITLSQI